MEELKSRLTYVTDVCTLCDILEITEEELLDRFDDKIDDKLEKLLDLLPEDYDYVEL